MFQHKKNKFPNSFAAIQLVLAKVFNLLNRSRVLSPKAST